VDTSQEIDLDLQDMQDHKFIVSEYVDLCRKKQDNIINYTVESVLDEMINLRLVQNINDG